mgnify:CR=1 FL=1
MKASFVEKLRDAPPAIGTLVTLGSAEVAEILSLCGYDWLFIDMEHGPLSIGQVQDMVRAVRGGCSAIVRVPENAPVWIKRALDTGCDGLIIPHVNSADEAQRAVAAAKYPPQGERSAGVGRAHGYGLAFDDYVRGANERVALVIQVEHIDAVDNLDSILAVEGVDAALIGPYDLSGSMNRLGDVGSAPVQAAINTVKAKCREKDVPLGMFVMQAEDAQKEIDDGCRFMAISVDSVLLAGAAKRALEMIGR